MSLIAGILQVSTSDPVDNTGEWQSLVLTRQGRGIGNGSILFALMSKLRKEDALSTEFHWFERDPVRNDFYAAAAALAGATTVTFNDAKTTPTDLSPLMALNMVLESAVTGEMIRVTADPTTSNVAVQRGYAGTTAAAITAGDLFTRVAIAAEEGAGPSRAVFEQPENLVNYIQTFNSSLMLTNAFKGSQLRSDMQGPLRQARLQALERITRDIEMTYFLGRKSRTTGSNGGIIYMTGGIRDALEKAGPATSTNILDGQGTAGCTLEDFKLWMRSFMMFGSEQKLAFCGPDAFAAISNYANSPSAGFRIMNNETVFGMNITTIVTPFGILELTMHPLFITVAAHQGSIFVVDVQNIVQKVMEPLFLQSNIQLPGTDSLQEQFRAKLGIKLKFAQAFGYAHDLLKIIP